MVHDENDEGEELLYEGAQCCRCDLDLDPWSGYCPNDRCPFHSRFQDEIVRWSPLRQEEEEFIAQIRSRFDIEGHH